MEFSPTNAIIQLCVQGMNMEDQGFPQKAEQFFLDAWNQAANDFEKFIAAYFVARHQKSVSGKLQWLEKSLGLVLDLKNPTAASALPSLYSKIGQCYEELNEPGKAEKNYELAREFSGRIADVGPFYHGTKAGLKVGDFLTAGFHSNYQSTLKMNHIYFTALVNGASLAAALANGDGSEHIFIVEPTGPFENDPNVTDKKFPGNPTRSYRTAEPLKIVGEVTGWDRQHPEQIAKWREKLRNNKGEIIN